jgi:transposase
MTRSQLGSTPHGRLLASGGSASLKNVWRVSKRGQDTGDQPAFPPDVVVAVKALACELPHEHGIPVSRLSKSEIQRAAIERGIVASIGETTVWRWLAEDAIRPWSYRSWIFPRDPDFQQKAARILDLYEGKWRGKPLTADDYVISADEKTSIQARRRRHSTLPPQPGRLMRVEHEYKRCGAWAYLAAWDVRRARIFGRCERSSGIESFERLVQQVMRRRPYCTADRVFWIMDNGSSHRGEACVRRLQERWPNIIPVHAPIHASWLNQIEIYFSIVQRKALTPNDFESLADVEERLMDFQVHYEAIAQPFQWKFTRRDLRKLLQKLDERDRLSDCA